MKILRNQKGSVLMVGVTLLAIAGSSLFYILNQNKLSSSEGVKELKLLKGQFEAKKVYSIVGYLISNNFIRCSSNWKNGVDKMSCIFDGETGEGSFKPEDFGFLSMDFKKNNEGKNLLTFLLENEFDMRRENPNYEEGDALVKYPGKVMFELIDVLKDERIKKIIGKMPEEVLRLDKDPYYVKVDVDFSVPREGGKTQDIHSSSIFKRPLAETNTKIIASSCASQCPSSVGEHPFPSCRGSFTIDGNTTTDVTAYTYNEGPGVVYDLAYDRKVVFNQEVSGVEPQPASSISVPMKDGGVLRPGETTEWSDKVPCAAFVQNITRRVTNTKTIQGSGTSSSTTSSSTSTSVSQHSEPAGSLEYTLGINLENSYVEPFRLIKKSNRNEGDFKGKLIRNVNTITTNTVIYVDPPH